MEEEVGMVIMPDVVFRAHQSLKTDDAKVIYMSPQGNVLNQQKVIDLDRKSVV